MLACELPVKGKGLSQCHFSLIKGETSEEHDRHLLLIVTVLPDCIQQLGSGVFMQYLRSSSLFLKVSTALNCTDTESKDERALSTFLLSDVAGIIVDYGASILTQIPLCWTPAATHG